MIFIGVNRRYNGIIIIVDREYLLKKLLEKVNKIGHYPGDFNLGNIIVENGINNLKIRDIQGKK